MQRVAAQIWRCRQVGVGHCSIARLHKQLFCFATIYCSCRDLWRVCGGLPTETLVLVSRQKNHRMAVLADSELEPALMHLSRGSCPATVSWVRD